MPRQDPAVARSARAARWIRIWESTTLGNEGLHVSGLLTNDQRRYHFDRRQFHRMTAAGVFDDQTVELVGGEIFAMTDMPPHRFAVGRLREALRAVLPREEWTIREEKPVLMGRYWTPQPDIAVLRGSDAIFAARRRWVAALQAALQEKMAYRGSSRPGHPRAILSQSFGLKTSR